MAALTQGLTPPPRGMNFRSRRDNGMIDKRQIRKRSGGSIFDKTLPPILESAISLLREKSAYPNYCPASVSLLYFISLSAVSL